jgi:O-antigen ligase
VKIKFLQGVELPKEMSFWVWGFISLYLLFSMISISISEIFIFLAFLCWLAQCIKGRPKHLFPGFFWGLIVYAGLTVVSSFFSVDPEVSFKASRELTLFLIVPIVYSGFAREKDISKANFAFLVSAYISILYSIFYFIFQSVPEERITGFMGHYMTQAGLLCLFCTVALSLFLFSREKTKYLWGAGFVLALGPFALTLTRSAWVGLAAAIVLILLLYKPKTLIFIPLVLGLFFLVSPRYIKQRAFDIFNLKNETNIHRIEYLKAGIQIIRDYPVFGTGPDMADDVFQDSKYGLSDIARDNVHLHNNITQIAAERGIPALVAWLAFMVWAFVSLIKLLSKKNPDIFPLAVAALAALVALATSGLFEYNFGDSEITVLFLYIITIPFTLTRIKKGEN